MRQMKIEIDGEMRDVEVFESMWAYVDEYGATVEDYVLSPAEFDGEKLVRSFRPVDDSFFGTSSQDMVQIGDLYYQHVNWGEDEYCLIPESEVDASLWIVYEWNAKRSEYWTQGQIFETEEEARKMYRCRFWHPSGDCGKGLCPQYKTKENCEVEEIDPDETGYYLVHEEAP